MKSKSFGRTQWNTRLVSNDNAGNSSKSMQQADDNQKNIVHWIVVIGQSSTLQLKLPLKSREYDKKMRNFCPGLKYWQLVLNNDSNEWNGTQS
jgi:hypothetical protein